ncbi:MAG: serine/threonine-protein kinase [Terriglobia bacterium]
MKSCPTCQATYPSRFSVCPQDGVKLIESSEWTEGAVIRGKYRILNKVGQGGMGAVYKASHVMFDELRALKVINPELIGDELFLKRFRQEAVIARKLDHPNAVRVDDIDESEDGLPFIVMEYIEGRSLKDLIEAEGPLSARRTCAIVRQVAAALNAAHRLGMVHRDIKPANIVLVETPRGEQAKVLDFGIAKIKEARAAESSGMTLTGTGIVMGTPQYMSPEQALGKRGDQLDGRSDIYSLGVVMYQMLTGDLPFKADTTMQLLLAHINTPPRPVLEARPGTEISPALAAVVMKCLEKNPDQRPPTGAALVEALAGVDAGAAGVTESEHKRVRMTPPTGVFPAERGPIPAPREDAKAQIFETQVAIPQEMLTGPPAPRPEQHRHKGLAAIIAAIVVIAIVGTLWAIHHFQTRTAHPSQAVASAGHEAAASPAALPSSPPNATPAAPDHPVSEPANITSASASTAAALTTENTAAKHELAEAEKTTTPGKAGKAGGTSSRETKRLAQMAAPPLAASATVGEQKTTDTAPAVNGNSPPGSSQPAANPSLSSVIVTTAPEAQIFIDGKPAGAANAHGKLTVSNLSSGSHDLRATLPGFNDIEYAIQIPPGATSFVSAKWGASQAAVPQESARPQMDLNRPNVAGAAVSFPVTYLHRLGSSRGVLVIQSGKVHYVPANGSGAFISPLNGISWGSSVGKVFHIRLASGQNYRFRSRDAAQILAALQHAATAQ